MEKIKCKKRATAVKKRYVRVRTIFKHTFRSYKPSGEISDHFVKICVQIYPVALWNINVKQIYKHPLLYIEDGICTDQQYYIAYN